MQPVGQVSYSPFNTKGACGQCSSAEYYCMRTDHTRKLALMLLVMKRSLHLCSSVVGLNTAALLLMVCPSQKLPERVFVVHVPA